MNNNLLPKAIILENKRIFRRHYIVYYLIHGNEIVYVGKSTTGISRINQHSTKGEIVFTHYWYKSTTAREITQLEKDYIKYFNPKYNKQHSLIEETVEGITSTGKIISFKHKRRPKKPWNKRQARAFFKKQSKVFSY